MGCQLFKCFEDAPLTGTPADFMFKTSQPGNFLVVQWLRLCASTAVTWIHYWVKELRSCKPRSTTEKKKKKIQSFLICISN